MPTKNLIVQVTDEVNALLKQGKKVPGQIMVDLENGVIVFKAFDKSKRRKKDLLLKTLEHGWVKESSARIKVYDSLPKGLGTNRIIRVLGREMNEAVHALVDREINENV